MHSSVYMLYDASFIHSPPHLLSPGYPAALVSDLLLLSRVLGLVTCGGSCLKPAQSFLVMLTFIPGTEKGGVCSCPDIHDSRGERLGHSSVTSRSPSTAAGGTGGQTDGGGEPGTWVMKSVCSFITDQAESPGSVL